MSTPVIIPLLNPNEPEALLTALYVRDGQAVRAGDLLCSLETTKSAADLHAESDGYIAGLCFSAGQTVRARDTLCYLADSPGEIPEATAAPLPAQVRFNGDALPDGLRITQPALALARQHSLDLSSLPTGPLVTEAVVKDVLGRTAQPAFAQKTASPALSAAGSPFDSTAILIYGGGGHGKMVIDLLRALGMYRIVGIMDDGRAPGDLVLGVPVIGGATELGGLYDQGVRLAVNAVGGIGNINIRIKIFERLAEAGFACPALVHPTAYVDASAVLAPGAQVFVRGYLGGDVQVGYGCILNTGCIISHDCRLGDYANISPGAILAGEVQVGSGSLIGMGVTVNLGVKVGRGARIGNSAVIKGDVPEGGVVRAGAVWPS
jgi:acetyltransferase EpsM